MFHMEQKDYKLLVVSELMKKEGHVRAITKSLNTNHMMVSRKMNELLKENVVDFRKEGKNKVFFLKKSVECRAYVFMAETYKLISLIRKYGFLRKTISGIQKDSRIKLAVLFGSYAKGTANKDSDIDVYIDTEERKIKQDLQFIDSKLSIKIGNFDKDNLLIKEIEKNHVIIKGIEWYYAKNKFFD